MGTAEGSLDTTLIELEVNPEIKPGLFRLDLPKGFEQIDDFAP